MFHFDPHLEPRGWRKLSENDEDGTLDYIFSIFPAGPLDHHLVRQARR